MTKKTIKETSQEIGKAIARSTHKVENVVDTVSKKAFDLLGNKDKPKEDMSSPTCPFRINEGNSLEGQIGETAGVIYEYLLKNETVATSRLVNAVMRQKHTKANVYAAIGWLMREAKLEFTEDGAKVELRE